MIMNGGSPIHEDQRQFEHLCLESLQCGLSWLTILNKRDIIRQCFDYFDVDAVAQYTETDIERIMSTEGMLNPARRLRPSSIMHRRSNAFKTNLDPFANIYGLSPIIRLLFMKAILREGCLLKMNYLRALAKTLRNEGSNL